jgi:hypothetical protein
MSISSYPLSRGPRLRTTSIMLGDNGNFWVKATTPAPTQIITLSTIDQYTPKQWMARALFFPVSPELTHEQIYSHLKEGLSRTLTQAPILTGRICRQSESSQLAAIRIDEHSGVEFGFKEHSIMDGQQGNASTTFPAYAKLKMEHFPMRSLGDCCAPKALLSPVAEDGTVFAAQANFMPGGLALVCAVAHLVADAAAWAAIVKLWALHTAEAARGEPPVHSTALEFDEIRQKLSQGIPDVKGLNDPLWMIDEVAGSPLYLPKAISASERASVEERARQDKNGNSGERPANLSSWRIWYFAPEKLRQLKQAASAPGAVQWISTMDALFALFWHRSSIFRHLSGRGHENSSCRILMDLRSRMQPPLDPNYVGNAVSVVATECPVSELESFEGTSAALSTLAQKIRWAVNSWDLSAFKAWIGTANSLHPDKGLRHPSRSLVEPNILMNDHSKLAVHNLDWGAGLGSLESVRGLEPDFPVRGLAICNVLPMFSDGGLEVATLFDNHVNEALAKDEVFMHYAELRYG